MTDFTNKCLIDRDAARSILLNLQAHCNSFTRFEQDELVKALNQDLSGALLVQPLPNKSAFEGNHWHTVAERLIDKQGHKGDTKE